MSTRAQITIEGAKVYVYKHSDGYPDGVLPILEPFTKEFFKERGYDPEYFLARLVTTLGEERRASRKEIVEEYRSEKGDWDRKFAERMIKEYSKPDFLGIGIDTQIHGDIEYLYEVSKTGEIHVLQPKAGSRQNPNLTRHDFGAYVEDVVPVKD